MTWKCQCFWANFDKDVFCGACGRANPDASTIPITPPERPETPDDEH